MERSSRILGGEHVQPETDRGFCKLSGVYQLPERKINIPAYRQKFAEQKEAHPTVMAENPAD